MHKLSEQFMTEALNGPEQASLYYQIIEYLKTFGDGRAVESGKKVLCLFRPDSGKNLSAMIAGCPHLELVNYSNLGEAKLVIGEFLKN